MEDINLDEAKLLKTCGGLWPQLDKIVNTTRPYEVNNFTIRNLKEIVDEQMLTNWRDNLHNVAIRLFTFKRITQKEFTNIKAMIESPDQETIYIAEQILKFKYKKKTNGKNK